MINGTDIVKLLNEMVASDQQATQKLVESRILCNESLADHPHVIVNEYNEVGVLGVLNGLLSQNESLFVVAAVYDDETVELEKFMLVRRSPVFPAKPV